MNVIFVFFCLLNSGKSDGIILKNDTILTDLLIENCIGKIVSKLYEDTFLVFVINFPELKIPYPVVVWNNLLEMRFFDCNVPKMYIIRTDFADLKMIFEKLEDLEVLNSRAFFLLIVENGSRVEIFALLAQFYIYKVILIESDDLIVNDPFIYENTEGHIEPHFWKSCDNFEYFFNTTMPLTWRNTTIESVYVEHFPYLYHDGENFVGENFQVSKILQEKLKFDLVFQEWVNSNSSDFMDLLQKREKHFLGNLQSVNSERFKKFDVVHVDMSAHFYWVVPPGIKLPAWRVFLLNFDCSVWFLILFSFIFLTIIYYFIGRESLAYSLFLHYQIFLESGNLQVSRIVKISSRVLMLTSIFSFFTISTTFKSILLRSFTRNVREYPINSIEDIIKHNLKCYVADDMKLLYKSINDFYYQYISSCVSVDENDNQQEVLLQTALNKDVATISRFLKLRFATNTLLTMGYEDNHPHLISKQVKFDFLYLYFTKGYPLFERVFEVLRRMDAGGFVPYFRKLIDFKVNKALNFNTKILSKNLKFVHISVAFYLFLGGLAISLVVFVIEISRKRRK